MSHALWIFTTGAGCCVAPLLTLRQLWVTHIPLAQIHHISVLECGASATGPNAALCNSLTQASVQCKCKQQGTLVCFSQALHGWVLVLLYCTGNLEQPSTFHWLPTGKGTQCFLWVSMLYITWYLGFCGSLLSYQHYIEQGIIKITNFCCSGFRKRRRTDSCWIPPVVSIHQPSLGLELSFEVLLNFLIHKEDSISQAVLENYFL